MEKQTKTLIIVILMTLVVIASIYFIIWNYTKDEANAWDNERELCEKLKGCEKYSCLADYSIFRSEKRNYLLQEQNCLLRLNQCKGEQLKGCY